LYLAVENYYIIEGAKVQNGFFNNQVVGSG